MTILAKASYSCLRASILYILVRSTGALWLLILVILSNQAKSTKKAVMCQFMTSVFATADWLNMLYSVLSHSLEFKSCHIIFLMEGTSWNTCSKIECTHCVIILSQHFNHIIWQLYNNPEIGLPSTHNYTTTYLTCSVCNLQLQNSDEVIKNLSWTCPWLFSLA